MSRKACLAALLLALSLTGCSNDGPESYTLRSDLCRVLDHEAFDRWFDRWRSSPAVAEEAKVDCVFQGQGLAGGTVIAGAEVSKFAPAGEAKKVFEQFNPEPSNMDGELKARVDGVRFFKTDSSCRIQLYDRDLYLKVQVSTEGVTDAAVISQIPRLTVEFTDQVLERLREKS